MQQEAFKIGVSRFSNSTIVRYDPKALEVVPDKYPDADTLHENARNVLQLLEHRSRKNNGDCKINDSQIAEVLDISLKTVSRCLSKLEKLRYIVRITETKRGANSKCSSRNAFYSIRSIRCNREFVRAGGKALSKEQLGWKTDPRPKVTPKVPEAYVRKVSVSYTYDGFEAFESYTSSGINLAKAESDNVTDGRFDQEYEELQDRWEIGEMRAKKILGFRHDRRDQ